LEPKLKNKVRQKKSSLNFIYNFKKETQKGQWALDSVGFIYSKGKYKLQFGIRQIFKRN
jgi:hypothetical protein